MSQGTFSVPKTYSHRLDESSSEKGVKNGLPTMVNFKVINHALLNNLDCAAVELKTKHFYSNQSKFDVS